MDNINCSASSPTMEEWQSAFDSKIKTKSVSLATYEKITLLLCDFNNKDQTKLMQKILFENHASSNNWFNYIIWIVKNNDKEKLTKMAVHLIRLINKGISCIKDAPGGDLDLKNDTAYIGLHFFLIEYTSDEDKVLKAFETMKKNKIGQKSGHVYQRWAQAHINLSKKKILSLTNEADKVKEMRHGFECAIAVLKTGIDIKAQPESPLSTMAKRVEKDLKTLVTSAEAETAGDEVVTFQKRALKQVSTSSKADPADSSSDEEDTRTQQIDFQTQHKVSEVPSRVTRTTVTTPAVKSVVPTRSTGLSGKCVRVTANSTGDSDEEEIKVVDSATIAPVALPVVASNLSVYVDENMKNFAPVWRGGEKRPRVNDENKPPVGVMPSTPAASRGLSVRPVASKLSFSIEETAVDTPKVPMELKRRTATPAKTVKSPAKSHKRKAVEEEEEDAPIDALNDSVVEFKSHKRQKSVAASRISSRSNKPDDVVTFASSKQSAVNKLTAATEAVSDEDQDSCTMKIADSSSDSIGATMTVALPPITVSTPMVSTIGGRFVYTPPVAPLPVATMPTDSPSEEDTVRVQTPPVAADGSSVLDSAMKSSARSLNDSVDDEMDADTVAIPASTVSNTAQSAVLSIVNPKIFRTATPIVAQTVVSTLAPTVPASPLVLSSAMATPVTSKRRRRVSFAGANENDPPLVTAAADTPVPAHRASVMSGENKDSNAVLAVASMKPTNSKLISGTFKNNFDDPANQIVLNGHQYVQFGVIGKGGSGVVTRIVSKETGATYAYKRIAISDHNCDHEAVERQFEDHENEIKLLRQLRGSPLIIELVDFEVNREALYVCMVLEVGDIDLARVLSGFQKQNTPTSSKSAKSDSSNSSSSLSQFMPRELDPRKIWREMLECVQCIHDQNIIHGDLKPANFVFVRGYLKLIDFGIANSISSDTTNVHLESQKGTLNYMSPESLTASDVKPSKHSESNQNERTRTMCLGRSSDVWSLGCILYQILYGRAPFADYPFIQKIGVITNKDTVIQYPETNSAGQAIDNDAIRSMQSCLVHDRRKRAPIAGPKGLLNMPFLVTKSSCQCGVQQCASTLISTTQTSSNTGSSSSSGDSSASTQKLTRTTTEPIVLQAIPAFSKKVVPAPQQSLLVEKAEVLATPAKPALLSSTNSVREVFKNLAATAASASTPRVVAVNNENSGISTKTKASFVSSAKKVRTPLKALPTNIQQQITSDGLKSNLLTSSATNERAAKWMKPQTTIERPTMKSVLEEKMASMRQFMCPEADDGDATATRTIDNTGFDFF